MCFRTIQEIYVVKATKCTSISILFTALASETTRLLVPDESNWHNTLGQVVRKLCGKVGCIGHYTNHSLRRTCATRLFNRGIEEQQIMAVTGHRTVNAVRAYKEISLEQQQKVSDLIQSKPIITEKEVLANEIKEDDKKEATQCASTTFNFSSCSVTVNYNK